MSREHVHDVANFDIQASLFLNLAPHGRSDVFTGLDIPARDAPLPFVCPVFPANHYDSVASENDSGNARFHVV